MTDAPQPDAAPEYAGLSASLKGGRWSLRARWRLTLIVLASCLVVPLQWVVMRIIPPLWWPLCGLWHRTVGWLMGVRVVTIGTKVRKGPVLFVGNHISWLDILILGGRLPNASFVAKSEIAGWGLAATLTSLHRTIFVERGRRSDSANQRDRLMERLKEGSGLIMFPESTSTDGVRMDPFKSSLFSVAEKGDTVTDGHLVIQPVTISFTEMNGMPLVRSQKPRVAWLGEVEIVSHFRAFLDCHRTTVTLEFHDPVTVEDLGNRKQLAAHAETVVREGLQRSHRLEYRMGPRDAA